MAGRLPGLRVRDARAGYAYDQLGDRTSVTTPDGKSSSYVYDVNGDVLSQTDPAGAQVTETYDFMQRRLTATQVERYPTLASLTTTNSYTYDEAGRLTGWNNGTAHSYGYDKAGNLTSNNGASYSYDARNQLTSDGANTYTYAADGDVASQTSAQGVVTSFTSDAYQQQVTAGTSSYGYDGLGRLLTAGTVSSPVSLTYSGMGDQVASDPSATYSRDPSGSVTGVSTAGGGKTIALTDQHMDLSGMFTAAGTTLAGSSTFDPWGNVLASTGSAVQAGFQGGWTDPITKQVHMGPGSTTRQPASSSTRTPSPPPPRGTRRAATCTPTSTTAQSPASSVS